MNKVIEQMSETALGVADEVQQVITETERTIETTVEPVRKNIVKRYPTVFLLMVTFGVALTFFGIEQMLYASPIFSNYPWISVCTGMLLLFITGTMYRKLG